MSRDYDGQRNNSSGGGARVGKGVAVFQPPARGPVGDESPVPSMRAAQSPDMRKDSKGQKPGKKIMVINQGVTQLEKDYF